MDGRKSTESTELRRRWEERDENVGCALLLKKEEEDGGALAPTPASHRRIDVATRSATMARDCCGGAAR